MTPSVAEREFHIDSPNPSGLLGIEFIEYATAAPEALGALLQAVGFEAVARHRSRNTVLYRQGAMNLVVNGHAGHRGQATPVISALGLQVRDAAAAHGRALALGAWGVPSRVAVMELNIPAIHGAGSSCIYFIDRCGDPARSTPGRSHRPGERGADTFSIWDVDFVPIAGAPTRPPAIEGLHFFGVVQYIGLDRMADWVDFYGVLFGFELLPEDTHFGILPRGRILRSPRGGFHLQLIEMSPDVGDPGHDESLQRIAFGAPDVMAAVQALQQRGARFVDRAELAPGERGALTEPQLGGVSFELVRHAA